MLMNIHTLLIIHEVLIYAEGCPAHHIGVSNQARSRADGPRQELLSLFSPPPSLNPVLGEHKVIFFGHY